MNPRAAWSTSEDDMLVFTDLDTGSVRVQHHHVDDFEADGDFSVTVGEFKVADLQRALIAPRPATTHVANKRLNLLRRLLAFGKERA